MNSFVFLLQKKLTKCIHKTRVFQNAGPVVWNPLPSAAVFCKRLKTAFDNLPILPFYFVLFVHISPYFEQYDGNLHVTRLIHHHHHHYLVMKSVSPIFVCTASIVAASWCHCLITSKCSQHKMKICKNCIF